MAILFYNIEAQSASNLICKPYRQRSTPEETNLHFKDVKDNLSVCQWC